MTSNIQRHHFYLVDSNPWPFSIGIASLATTSGFVLYMHYSVNGFIVFLLVFSLYYLFHLIGGKMLLEKVLIKAIIQKSSIWFGLKITFILFLFVWVRAAFPRFRYDQLMRLGWKVFLPFSLAWLTFISGFLFGFDFLP